VLLALLAGVGVGLVYCLPVSSVNVEIVRRGLAAGFHSALLVSLGAIVGDLAWLAGAVLGAELILARPAWRAAIGLAGALVLWWLAWDALRSSRRAADVIARAPSRPGRDFWVGALLCLSNPQAILVLMALIASVGPRTASGGTAMRGAFYAGIPLGAVVFSFAAAGVVAWGRRFVTPRSLALVERASAAVLAGLGVLLAWQTLGLVRG
jgi:threonine/homoserine/homoserine lactone efflux protein